MKQGHHHCSENADSESDTGRVHEPIRGELRRVAGEFLPPDSSTNKEWRAPCKRGRGEPCSLLEHSRQEPSGQTGHPLFYMTYIVRSFMQVLRAPERLFPAEWALGSCRSPLPAQNKNPSSIGGPGSADFKGFRHRNSSSGALSGWPSSHSATETLPDSVRNASTWFFRRMAGIRS